MPQRKRYSAEFKFQVALYENVYLMGYPSVPAEDGAVGSAGFFSSEGAA